MENSPPIRKEPPSYVWTCEIGRKIALNFGKDLFSFFGGHLILGGKNVWILEFGRKITLNFGEDLFFWRSPNFGRKKLWISDLSETFHLKFRTNRLKLIQGQWKFESRSFAHFSLFQNSPPPFPNPGYDAPELGLWKFRANTVFLNHSRKQLLFLEKKKRTQKSVNQSQLWIKDIIKVLKALLVSATHS